MSRWAALIVVFCTAGCTNAPIAGFLDVVHPIHVGPDNRAANPIGANPNIPAVAPPPPDAPPSSGQLLPTAPLIPGSPPLPSGPSGSNFAPAPSNSDTAPLSIPNP
jgi:hypothetical protein